MDERRTDPYLGKCSGEVFIHPTNLGGGFVQVPFDGNSQKRTSKIDPLIIPGGCTKYLQAPDKNKPLKANVTEKYDEWLAGEAHSFTSLCSPPRRDTTLAAGDGLDKTMISNSFKSCANRCSGWIRGRTHSLLQGR